MGVMTPTSRPNASRHDTLINVTSKGTDRRTIRVDPELWDEFGEWARDFPGGASGALRTCMRYLLGKPGSTLPRNVEAEELRQWLSDLADELAEDSSGDWGEERDPVGVGWQRACQHYAQQIRERLAVSTGPSSDSEA
jgi:hypothetical protein